MRVPPHPTLLRRMIQARIKRLTARSPVLQASLVQIAKHCGRAGCRCQSGRREDKHVGHYITFPCHGKTHTVYVPLDMIEEVRAWIAETHRLKELIREISELAVAQIRGHVTAQKRKAGRS